MDRVMYLSKKWSVLLFPLLMLVLFSSLCPVHATPDEVYDFSAEIVSLDYPSTVEPGEAFTITGEFSYQDLPSPVAVELFEKGWTLETEPLDSQDFELQGSGTHPFSLSTTAPDVEVEWGLDVTLWAWKEGEWVLLDEENIYITVTTVPVTPWWEWVRDPYFIGGIATVAGAVGWLAWLVRAYTKRKKRPPKVPVKPISVPAVPYPEFLRRLQKDLKDPSKKWKRFKEYKPAQHIDGRVVDNIRKDILNIKVDGKKLTKDDLKGDKWKNLTLDQKKDYLKKALKAVINGLGLDKVGIKLKFVNMPDTVRYMWKNAAGKEHATTNFAAVPLGTYWERITKHHGGYSLKTNEATINTLDFGRGRKGVECLDTIVHELRHAYQDLHKKDKNYYGMTMKANMHNYVSAAHDPKYRTQPMEADAWKFAEKVDC